MTLIKRQFLIFHQKNPQLWHWIDHYALEVAARRPRYAIASVIERARWHTDIETEGDVKFKIRACYAAHYARMWMLRHPEYKDFFRTLRIPDDSLPDATYYGPPLEEAA